MKPLQLILGYIILFVLGSCSSPQSNETTADQKPATEKSAAVVESESTPLILFFGNSLTAGYGLDPEQAFPHLIQLRLDNGGYSYKVINAGLSGETTASGVNRIEWVLREPVAIMVLELGGNDGLRGIDPQVSKNNLQKIIDQARQLYPEIKIVLAGMEAPPNMGQDYITNFRSIFPELAAENQLPLIPFLLEGVGGEPEFNLPDGIHPNQEGHQMVAETVWKILKDQLSKPIASDGS